MTTIFEKVVNLNETLLCFYLYHRSRFQLIVFSADRNPQLEKLLLKKNHVFLRLTNRCVIWILLNINNILL